MSAAGSSTTPTPNKDTHDYSVTLNGITWTALATKPTSASNSTPTPTFINEDGPNKNNGTINDSTTQVTITGTVPSGQALKYKYTSFGNGGPLNIDNNNNVQTLPSNIKTIKITLKKAGSSTGK